MEFSNGWFKILPVSWHLLVIFSVQFSSVTQSYLTLCDPMNRSTPGLPVHHQRPEFTQTHVLWVSDAIQPSHPLSSPSPPAPNPSQHQSLFQWVNSSHEVAKVRLVTIILDSTVLEHWLKDGLLIWVPEVSYQLCDFDKSSMPSFSHL